jgi:xylulokinase
VLLPKDFVRLRLCGEAATDVSDASGTGLLDVARRAWATELTKDLGLDPRLFPDVHESAGVAGRTAEGVPVAAGAGDQAAAAVGVGAIAPGVVSLSLGTSGVAFSATDAPVPDPTGSVHVFCHANGAWHAMGVVLSCGGAVRWARDVMAPGADFDAFAALAAEAPPGCDGLTFLPYLAGARCPFVDPHARGAWHGLSLAHGRAHLARSVFEGAAFALADAVDALTRLGARVGLVRITGGGAASPFWRGIVADALGASLTRLETDQGPAFGAALLGGVAAGVWPDVEQAVVDCVRETDSTEPAGTDHRPALDRFRALCPAQSGPKP